MNDSIPWLTDITPSDAAPRPARPPMRLTWRRVHVWVRDTQRLQVRLDHPNGDIAWVPWSRIREGHLATSPDLQAVHLRSDQLEILDW